MLELQREILRAGEVLRNARRVVCLTGAGVSAESGVPTFREAQTGLWTRFDPQQLASQEGFQRDPGLVWRWYMHRLATVEDAQPNAGHRALAALERGLPEFALVTQNVDDLHERAGSRHVLHLHGTIRRFHCNGCGYEHDPSQADRESLLPPRCVNCGDLIRPSVVWFGERLPSRVLDRAWRASERCDVMIVVGTSGVVYPAAQLPFLASQMGAQVIEVNTERTPISAIADLLLIGRSAELLPSVVAAFQVGQEDRAKED